MLRYWLWTAVLAAGLLSGCTTVTVKHEVSHIYATVDVNIRIQEEFEEIFDYEKARGVAQSVPAQNAKQGELQ